MTMLPVLFSMSKSMSSSPPGIWERWEKEMGGQPQLDFCLEQAAGAGSLHRGRDPRSCLKIQRMRITPPDTIHKTHKELMPSHRYMACQAIYLHSSCTSWDTARLGTVP